MPETAGCCPYDLLRLTCLNRELMDVSTSLELASVKWEYVAEILGKKEAGSPKRRKAARALKTSAGVPQTDEANKQAP